MSEVGIEKKFGDIELRAYAYRISKQPNLSRFHISFCGESPRFELIGPCTLEELRDLHYNIGRIIAQAEELAEIA